MECVMVLLGEKSDWDTVKKVLGNVGEFMGKLLDYNVEETTEKTWKNQETRMHSYTLFKQTCLER